jgi:hypothetical protein
MNIFSFVRDQRQNYQTKKVKITNGYNYNQADTLNLIELYYNSQFSTGNLDSNGREKPFYNINKFRVNVATRATDLDVKDIKIESETSDDYVRSFLLTKENQVWMKEVNFGKFLNDLGHTRSKYGGVVIKKTEHDGKLQLDVVPWKDLITDQTDILKGVVIERHFYTPSELMAMDGLWDNVKEALDTAHSDKDDVNETNTTETPGDYIEVFEIHGDLPDAYMKDLADVTPDDWKTYSSQVHIIAGVDSYEALEDGGINEKGITLFKAKEKESPYKYLAWDQVPGRALGIGIVEDGFEAQVWTNDAVYKEKELVEIASKIIFQTPDKTIGSNVLTDLENGAIVNTKANMPLTQVNTVPTSLPEFKNLVNSWKDQLDRTNSTFAANIGEALPSGTPYRLGAILNQEGNSMFDYRRQEEGIFLQELYEDWILPHLVKRLKSKHTLAAEFSEDEMNAIDDAHIEQALKQHILDEREKGNLVLDVEGERQRLKQQMMRTRNKRFIDIPKEYYEDLDCTISVITTNETRVKAAVIETLSNLLNILVANLGFDHPMTKKVFNKIAEVSGAFSPVELQMESNQPTMNQPDQTGQSGQPGMPGQGPQPPMNPLSAPLIPQQAQAQAAPSV